MPSAARSLVRAAASPPRVPFSRSHQKPRSQSSGAGAHGTAKKSRSAAIEAGTSGRTTATIRRRIKPRDGAGIGISIEGDRSSLEVLLDEESHIRHRIL